MIFFSVQQNICKIYVFGNTFFQFTAFPIFVLELFDITNNFINSMSISAQAKHLKLPK